MACADRGSDLFHLIAAQMFCFNLHDFLLRLILRQKFTDYVQTITPHLLSYPEPPTKYMRTLLQRLHKFRLTKPEVLVMINLGVGVRKSPDSATGDVGTLNKEDGDVVGSGGGDLLDKVERHINSTDGHDGRQTGNGQTSDEDIAMPDEQEEANSDISVLNTIIEEMYERFNDADINEILRICGEVLGSNEDETYTQDK